MQRINYKGLLSIIGKNIKKYRKAKKLTLEELAWKVDMEKPDIHNIEAGKRNITIKTLVKISSALDVPVNKLIH